MPAATQTHKPEEYKPEKVGDLIPIGVAADRVKDEIRDRVNPETPEMEQDRFSHVPFKNFRRIRELADRPITTADGTEVNPREAALSAMEMYEKQRASSAEPKDPNLN